MPIDEPICLTPLPPRKHYSPDELAKDRTAEVRLLAELNPAGIKLNAAQRQAISKLLRLDRPAATFKRLQKENP